MEGFKQIGFDEFNFKIFKKIDKDWGLIVSSDGNRINPMTASWMGFGILWNKPVTFIFIRPTRFTYQLMENSSNFSLSFFTENFRKQLNFCGTKSGRDYDKIKEVNFTTGNHNYTSYVIESEIIFFCQKLYYSDINPENFIDGGINKLYDNDFHRMYIAEISEIQMKI